MCLAAALFALAVAGCGPRKTEPLRLAVTPWPGYEYVFVAQAKDYFRAEGLDVRIVELETVNDSRSAFERQAVDIFAGTLVEVLVAQTRSGLRPQVFFVIDESNGSDMLVADSTIRTIADLRGRRVAFQPGSVDVAGLSAALQSEGLTLRDIVQVPLTDDMKAAAFLRGDVCAVQCFPPGATAIEARPGAHRLFDSTRIPGTIVDVFAADSTAISRDPERYAAFVRAFERAQEFAARHPDEAIAIMANQERIPPAAFRAALSGMRMIRLDRQWEHLGRGGHLHNAIELTARALRAAGGEAGIDTTGMCISSLALPREGWK